VAETTVVTVSVTAMIVLEVAVAK